MASLGKRKQRVRVDESLITDVSVMCVQETGSTDEAFPAANFCLSIYLNSNLIVSTVPGSERLKYCTNWTKAAKGRGSDPPHTCSTHTSPSEETEGYPLPILKRRQEEDTTNCNCQGPH